MSPRHWPRRNLSPSPPIHARTNHAFAAIIHALHCHQLSISDHQNTDNIVSLRDFTAMHLQTARSRTAPFPHQTTLASSRASLRHDVHRCLPTLRIPTNVPPHAAPTGHSRAMPTRSHRTALHPLCSKPPQHTLLRLLSSTQHSARCRSTLLLLFFQLICRLQHGANLRALR